MPSQLNVTAEASQGSTQAKVASLKDSPAGQVTSVGALSVAEVHSQYLLQSCVSALKPAASHANGAAVVVAAVVGPVVVSGAFPQGGISPSRKTSSVPVHSKDSGVADPGRQARYFLGSYGSAE